jgi:hypothetical protein
MMLSQWTDEIPSAVFTLQSKSCEQQLRPLTVNDWRHVCLLDRILLHEASAVASSDLNQVNNSVSCTDKNASLFQQTDDTDLYNNQLGVDHTHSITTHESLLCRPVS